MGFGSYNHSALRQIRLLVPRLLEGFTTAQIAQTSGNVIRVLADFKQQHPDKIPTKPGGSLLSIGPVQVNDFELALYFVDSKFPPMTDVIESANGLQPLIAYIEILTFDNGELPDESLFDSALSYLIASEKYEGDVAKLWNQELRKDVLRLAPLARTGQKFLTGRRPGKLGPVAKKIKTFLQRYPQAKAIVVWLHVKKSPPKGMVCMENARYGRYIEKGSETVMEWERFQNLVSEHRPKK